MQKIDGRFRCLIAGILILGGCAKLSTPGTTAPNAAETLKQIKCVAVVPFDNRTSDKAAGDVMARLVSMAGMSSGRFRAMDSGSVTTYLGFQNVQIASVTDARFAANLGKLLDVDAVLMGSVEEYGYRNAGGRSVSEPAVAMSARLVAVGTAEVVWSGIARRGSDGVLAAGRDVLSRVAWLAANDLVAEFPRKLGSGESLEACGKLQPDNDGDSDGILNFADKCPYQAELYNAVDDADGCPEDELGFEELSSLVDVKNGRLLYRGEIAFEEGTDRLRPHSVLLLKAVAIFLNRQKVRVPRIQIEGFSREPGTKKYQELFAFSRAEAVKKTLIENGVNPSRVSSVGYNSEEVGPQEKGHFIEFSILE